MKTTLDIEDILWTFLNSSSLKGSVNGGVYKRRRPTGSTKEDVVINCLPVNNLQVQSAVANVNIHVPNKVQNISGIEDSYPDHARLKALGNIAVSLLVDQWNTGYNFDVQQQNVFEDEDGKSHYVNIRLDFYSINILN